uniref:Secreted protein n=1 Tax=Biomphalaria glabrata TaxID=6526 RepID=A0A2C9L866_BIOGL
MNRMRIFNYVALLHIAALLIEVNDGIKEHIFVNLQEFNQKDSITNCTLGLLAQIDRLGLKAFLQYTGANDYAKTVVEIVSIEMKDSKSRVYSVLQEISFSRCLQRTSYFVRCEKITDNKYQISIQMLAKALMNKAILLIAISNGTHRIESNIINLPTVFDPFNVALHVNGKKLSPTECLIDLSDNKQITFCCDLNAPSATMATIYHKGGAVAESERCAAHFAETHANDDSMSFLCNYCNARTENITCRLIFGHTPVEKNTEKRLGLRVIGNRDEALTSWIFPDRRLIRQVDGGNLANV